MRGENLRDEVQAENVRRTGGRFPAQAGEHGRRIARTIVGNGDFHRSLRRGQQACADGDGTAWPGMARAVDEQIVQRAAQEGYIRGEWSAPGGILQLKGKPALLAHRGGAEARYSLTQKRARGDCGQTERLSVMGASLLIDTLQALEAGTLTRIPQDESAMTYDPMLNKDMGVLDWTRPAAEIVNRIHGLNPWPGCTTPYEGQRLKLLRAEVADGAGQPGEILTADPKGGLVIAAGEGAVRVTQMQAPGGKPMNPKDYLRGHPMAVGTVLKEEQA